MDEVALKLLPVDETGEVLDLTVAEGMDLPEMVKEINHQMVDFYANAGFQVPWIAYVSVVDGEVVGGGTFKSVPYQARVEIAYYTIPEFENQGFATATAQALIDMAIQTDEELTIVAQTLPEKSAANQILQKLGFTFYDVVDHPAEGPVWEWRLF